MKHIAVDVDMLISQTRYDFSLSDILPAVILSFDTQVLNILNLDTTNDSITRHLLNYVYVYNK